MEISKPIMNNLTVILSGEGYFNFRFIEGRGLCGLYHFIFTTGLCYGLDEVSYVGRYCFENLSDAKEALEKWDGKDNPKANWIKHKGKEEYSNPNNGWNDEEERGEE